jgi:predicted kinase
MTKPKLIVLNGFAAAGKTTIAQKYIAEHPLALALEADAIVDNIGDWTSHEEEVRQLTFELTKAMLQVYLATRHDVILPYLVTSAAEVQEFQNIARAHSADYYEVLLHNERTDAIARLFARGKWGEATSPPLTEADRPAIEALLDKMETALEQRPDTISIPLKDADAEATYQRLLRVIRQ